MPHVNAIAVSTVAPSCPPGCPWRSGPMAPMLLYHLSHHHPDQVGPYLERMRTECIATVAAEAYEVVEEKTTVSDIPPNMADWPRY